MNTLILILYVIIAYFIGNLDFGYILVRLRKGKDIRSEGSGNPGTANVLRTYGKKMALAVFAGDFLKGFLVMFVAKWLGISGWWLVACGLAVVAGHNWPVLLKFKGGKGVATTIGVLFASNVAIGIYPLTLGLTVAFLTKIISIGSIVGVCSFPIFTFIYTGTSDIYLLTLGIILAVLNVFQHRQNIVRLLNGEELKATKKANNKKTSNI